MIVDFCELEGDELDEAVALALGHRIASRDGAKWVVTADESEEGGLLGYIGGEHVPLWSPSAIWAQGGPLIDRFQIHLSGPESSVHRNGGPKAGWGQRGTWAATSWKLRDAKGRRGAGYHETSQLVAAMRLIVAVLSPKTSELEA